MNWFSVVIPSYDRPDLLERLLESIRRQTFRDFDVVVVDDASPDREAYMRLVRRFSGEISLRYLRSQQNRGAQYSRNMGVAESNGAYLAFVDDDDEWLPHKLERQAALLESGSDRVGLVYAWADAVAEDGAVCHRYRATHRGEVLADLLDSCFIPSPTVVVRRAALAETGGFDEDLPSCQDWDMWTRVAAAGYSIDVAEEVLAFHHKHGRASVGTSSRSLEGFARYYAKHAGLYKREGMSRNLSEKYRGLAWQATRSSQRKLAEACLRRSIGYWKWNWKAGVRYAQLLLQKRTD